MVVVRNPLVIWRRTLLGTLVLAPGADTPELLAPPGDAVWDALAHPIGEADLVEQLAGAFRGDPDVIASDVGALLEQLLGSGMVIEADESTRGLGR